MCRARLRSSTTVLAALPRAARGASGAPTLAASLYVVILVGPPGSGKSTLARAIVARAPGAWSVVNQDTLGSRGACVRAMADALARREHVIIDRCNFDVEQRRPWIQLAQWTPLRCAISAIVLTPSLKRCKARVLARTGHPTLSGPNAPRIVERMASLLVPPHTREGLEHVGWIRNEEPLADDGALPADVQRELQRLSGAESGAQPQPTRAPITAREQRAPIRVATFNLLADCWVNQPAWYPSTPGSALEPSARLATAVRAIRSIDADVVCVQEATPAALNGLADGLAGEYTISALCANQPTAAAAPNGVAFLVRERGALGGGRPWTSERLVWDGEGSASAALHATVGGATVGGGGAEGVPLAVLNSHLAHGEAGEDQARVALRWARDWCRAHPSGLLLWCGDFNLKPSHALVPCIVAAGLRDALGWSPSPTYFPDQARPGARPSRCDYVLFSAHTLSLERAHALGAPQRGAAAGALRRADGEPEFAVRRGASEGSGSGEDEPTDAHAAEHTRAPGSPSARHPRAAGGSHARRARSDGAEGRDDERRLGLRDALELFGSDHVPVVATLVPLFQHKSI
ncbi:hypothetical protein KFE25_006798 [Diacronema lutheri]|uniref:AAA+ ATPase domain-containing protein n=1 Tax=Diacronema lutheri TaxID=2081491 RepID=A0A8J5XRK0_DIALT|nr:hypothetical protein KFE25_006798 [Diacronema lutheri]